MIIGSGGAKTEAIRDIFEYYLIVFIEERLALVNEYSLLGACVTS
jgi:hypothetical protein